MTLYGLFTFNWSIPDMSEPGCSVAKEGVQTKYREGAKGHTSFYTSEPQANSGMLRLNVKIPYKIVSGVE